jgi:acyl-CoA thioester hydrolase
MKINPRLLDPGTYRHSVEITPRFSDVDTLRHLNNARLTEFYQEARVSFYTQLEREHGLRRPAEQRYLVAHIAIDYLAEVNYPQPVTMRVAVAHIGRTSQTLAIGLFSEGRCAGFARVVLVNGDAQGPAPIPDEWRDVLSRCLLPPDALPLTLRDDR